MKRWKTNSVGSDGVMAPVEYVVVQWLRDRCNDTILMAPIAVFSVDLANKQLSVLVNKQFSIFDAKF